MNDKKAYLMLVVHTEPPLDETGESVPKIAEVAHFHQMPVTWVVTKDVAEGFGNSSSELSKSYGWSLKNLNIGTFDDSKVKDEIGAHLHPYLHLGIEYKKFSNGSSSVDKYAVNMLGEGIQYKLIKELRDIITEHVGIQPTTFVAGRWAESRDGTTLRILGKLGFTADINLPFYKPPIGDSDWRSARYYQPYHPDRNDILKLGDSSILLIPQTVLPPRISTSHKTLILTDEKVLWPTQQNKEQVKRVLDYYYRLKESYSPVAMVIYMHSPDGAQEAALQNLDCLLRYVSNKTNIAFTTPQQYIQVFRKKYGDNNPKKIYSVPLHTVFLAKVLSSFWLQSITKYHALKRRLK